MTGKTLLTFSPLEEAILIKRYKRFLADVELKNGEIVTAHCANTGPMKGVLHIGGRVRVRFCPSPTRKLSWSWEQALCANDNGEKCWVGVNTSLPNKIVRLAIEAGLFTDELGPIREIRSEVKYGKGGRSRIDLLLLPEESSPDSRLIYLEVKNTTWKQGEWALFPDTITERGQKHLKELINVLPKSRAVLVPCISRCDVTFFAPGVAADPLYGELFETAISTGMEVLPCAFGYEVDKITWQGKRSYRKKA